MKKGTLSLMILLITSGVVFAQEKLADGYQKFLYGNGQISSEGTIRNGKPDGLWISYHVNGKVKSEGLRRNFELDSLWNFYDEQGKLTDQISYISGKKSGFHVRYQNISIKDTLQSAPLFRELYVDNIRQGLSYYYDKQGLMNKIVRYKDGKKHGLTREFRDTLEQVVYKYHNDFLIDREFINQTDARGLKQGVWRDYFDNDNIRMEANYKNGQLNGYYREYAQSGKMLLSRFYENGQLISREGDDEIIAEVRNQYDSNGNVVATGSFLNNIPVGVHRKYTEDRTKVKVEEYDNSGQVVSQGITDDKGTKEEYWKFYYPGGQIRLEGAYKEDKRGGLWKFYYPDGKLEQTGSYTNGLESGVWSWFYATGTVRREESYLRGKEDGLSTEYDENGTVIARGEYIEGQEEGEWFYLSGDQTEKGAYQAGLKTGIWRNYYADGTLKFEGTFVQGIPDGKHRYFHENGKIREEQFYRMGLKDKNWWVFDAEGNVVISYVYSNDILIRINGVKVNMEAGDGN
jgi:antitoxin component YwqK of YwqJK toxin-antitoxin module